jgi:hypothetical protein
MNPPRRSYEEMDEQLDQNPDGPVIEQPDWDALVGADHAPTSIPANGDVRYEGVEEGEKSGELPGEDDDNAYQESDEALPDDRDEASISRNPAKQGGRFDEI